MENVMKLNMKVRPIEKKSDAKSLRREGSIPAVFYSQGKNSENVSVDKAEFEAVLRQVKPGHLATTKLTLVTEDGKERQAIIKDIQYHVTTYNVVHLDFEELHSDIKVKVKVPIECTGAADCQGIKLGGVLRQVIRGLRVQCLPADMPDSFKLNISELRMSESKKLSDISIPASVKPLMDLNEVAVVITKR